MTDPRVTVSPKMHLRVSRLAKKLKMTQKKLVNKLLVEGFKSLA